MRAVIAVALAAACGGASHPAPPPAFDAKQLAAALGGLVAEMAAAVKSAGDDCPRMVDELGAVLERGRGRLVEARAAQQDPDRAKQLTGELRAYDPAFARKGEAIGGMLGICYSQHPELQDRIKRVVDSIPTL